MAKKNRRNPYAENPYMSTNRSNPPVIPANEPSPGSKEVKNRNHSRNNHGEGR